MKCKHDLITLGICLDCLNKVGTKEGRKFKKYLKKEENEFNLAYEKALNIGNKYLKTGNINVFRT